MGIEVNYSVVDLIAAIVLIVCAVVATGGIIWELRKL